MIRLKKWKSLPEFMRNDEVYEYYKIIEKKKKSLFIKRLFDIVFSFVLIILLMPILVFLIIWIKLDSKGPALFKQIRVTQYGREFNIFKLRTMLVDAESLGSSVTVTNDKRITKAGVIIRKIRLDEVPQLFNVFLGDMTFVGVRPEVPKYVSEYSNVMYATLLLPAGITSQASIFFKDENSLLFEVDDVDYIYVNEVLPKKMYYNLKSIKSYSFFKDLELMLKTIFAVLK